MTPREAWRANYRAHRAAAALWRAMARAGYDGPAPSFARAVPDWRSFDSCRAWPDRLAVYPLRDRRSHDCRMHGGPQRGRLP